MRLPRIFTRTVSRHSAEFWAGYTEGVTTAMEQAATGENTDTRAVSAVEFGAGLWSRGFAVAQTEIPAVTPQVLATIGRQLALRGESVWMLDTSDGLTLIPVSDHDVEGGPNPRSWQYRLTLGGPSGYETRNESAEGVLHFRINARPEEPWRGCSPLDGCGLSATLLANLEKRLGQEANARAATVLPFPEGMSDENYDALKQDLKTAKGEIHLVETQAGGGGLGRQAAPRDDWTPRRIGATLPQPNVVARDETSRGVVAALGIPPALWIVGDGAALRESYRQFLHTTLTPTGLIVADEMTQKLETSVHLDFARLAAADIASRARAMASLVKSGMEVDEAMVLAGLSE